jgi:hypothetical protein
VLAGACWEVPPPAVELKVASLLVSGLIGPNVLGGISPPELAPLCNPGANPGQTREQTREPPEARAHPPHGVFPGLVLRATMTR